MEVPHAHLSSGACEMIRLFSRRYFSMEALQCTRPWEESASRRAHSQTITVSIHHKHYTLNRSQERALGMKLFVDQFPSYLSIVDETWYWVKIAPCSWWFGKRSTCKVLLLIFYDNRIMACKNGSPIVCSVLLELDQDELAKTAAVVVGHSSCISKCLQEDVDYNFKILPTCLNDAHWLNKLIDTFAEINNATPLHFTSFRWYFKATAKKG